jgi:hypothetical protein
METLSHLPWWVLVALAYLVMIVVFCFEFRDSDSRDDDLL